MKPRPMPVLVIALKAPAEKEIVAPLGGSILFSHIDAAFKGRANNWCIFTAFKGKYVLVLPQDCKARGRIRIGHNADEQPLEAALEVAQYVETSSPNTTFLIVPLFPGAHGEITFNKLTFTFKVEDPFSAEDRRALAQLILPERPQAIGGETPPAETADAPRPS